MQERLDENPPTCDGDEAEEECFIGTIDVTKECPETEEEDVSSDDEDADPAEESVEEPIVEEETKVSSLQAAIAAMKTTDTELPESNKKKTALNKKNSVTGKNFSSVKKKNTLRKAPIQKVPRSGGKPTFNSRNVKGKNSRAPAAPYAGKRKPPAIRKSSKTSEKKRQPKDKAPPRKGRSSKPPRADEKTSLRHRFVIGEDKPANQ